MLKTSTRVYHSGHGLGVVVAHNTRKPSYVTKNLSSEAVAMAIGLGLVDAVVHSFYNGARYPYVIKFDSGYTDVYSLDDVT